MKKIILILSVFFLFSCTSSTERVRYYSLTLDSKIQAPVKDTVKQKQLVLIDPIRLARFLRQPGLVLQRGNNELITANYHRWAEPLDELISKLLLINLNNKSERFYFESSDGFIRESGAPRLKLYFDKFHATDHATVVISGRYGLVEPEAKTLQLTEFSIEEIQTHDGYLDTVEKLKKTLDKLADEILLTLNNMNLDRL
ncbi:MAG TPA: hypothetical protein ENJ60_06365 [Aeromonadales bacterium]|nr:hypothetical protein [Aeromonadales bacterium]